MIDLTLLDRRPIVVAIAGSNGAGKSTFYRAFLATRSIPFVNADEISLERGIDAYAAAQEAERIRQSMLDGGQSFMFETVMSDPVGEKVDFLRATTERGYTVVLFFIGIDGSATSSERVGRRVARGGHDVPDDKLLERYPRTLANLKRAIGRLPHVIVYDNSDLTDPYRRVSYFESGAVRFLADPPPEWLKDCLAGADEA